MIHSIRKGNTIYSINTKHQTPGFAVLIRENSDGKTEVPFPQELLGMIVRRVVQNAAKYWAAKMVPAWVDDNE
jgi:hypothetical protein